MRKVIAPIPLATSILLLTLSVDAQAAMIFTAGPNEGTLPQTWTIENVRLNSQGQLISRETATLKADRFGLRGEADVVNSQWPPHPAPVARVEVTDVVVNSATGMTPPPGTTTTVRFGGHLEGGLTGSGGGSVILDLVVPGKTNRTVAFNVDDFPVNDVFYTSPFTVTIGQPFEVFVSLRVGVSALPGHATIDFSDSFTFNPEAVFLLEPGFTASSESWGLVNNRLPAQVPEPATWSMLACLVIMRRRLRSSRIHSSR